MLFSAILFSMFETNLFYTANKTIKLSFASVSFPCAFNRAYLSYIFKIFCQVEILFSFTFLYSTGFELFLMFVGALGKYHHPRGGSNCYLFSTIKG